MTEYIDQSLRSKVFEQIRDDILSGVYQDGNELREIVLAHKMGVSRTPVREALRQLELEGLVTIIPNKGAKVTAITQKDVKDIYMVRSQLEGLCARWATMNITQDQIDELEEALFLAEYHVKRGTEASAKQVAELDSKFHQVLYSASNSRILEHVLKDFHKYVKMARQLSIDTPSRAEKSIQEHRRILEAIKARDEDLAEKLADEHIMNVMANLHIGKGFE